MKKNLILSLFFITVLSLQGVEAQSSIGNLKPKIALKAGVFSPNYRYRQVLDFSANVKSNIGIWTGLSFWFPISEYVVPFVEISYEQSSSQFNYSLVKQNQYRYNGTNRLSYTTISLVPNFVIPVGNTKINLYIGPHFSVLNGYYEKGTESNIFYNEDEQSETKIEIEIDGKSNNKTESLNTGIIAGFGVEYPLNQTWNLKADARLMSGSAVICHYFKYSYWGFNIGVSAPISELFKK